MACALHVVHTSIELSLGINLRIVTQELWTEITKKKTKKIKHMLTGLREEVIYGMCLSTYRSETCLYLRLLTL